MFFSICGFQVTVVYWKHVQIFCLKMSFILYYQLYENYSYPMAFLLTAAVSIYRSNIWILKITDCLSVNKLMSSAPLLQGGLVLKQLSEMKAFNIFV